MNVSIEVIPHKKQRYRTVGDWFFKRDGDLIIRVSKLSDWRYEMLVAIHELVEVVLCKFWEVSQDEVDTFDKAFESRREDGNMDEPGDDSKAPYRKEHSIATGVERIVAAAMFVDWKKYEDAINALP